LGYRKIDAKRASWIARWKRGGGKCKYLALRAEGDEFGWKEAKAKAEKWFAQSIEEGERTGVTVRAACEAYVENRKKKKPDNPGCAHDIKKRYERTVYNSPLGLKFVRDLKKDDIRKWLDGLKMKSATLERTYTALRAALNSAIKTDLVTHVAARQAWTAIELPDKPDNRRELCLSFAQRQALLNVTADGLHDLIEAAMLTGCRAGELTSAKREQFDARKA
jgi:hypothetical protein